MIWGYYVWFPNLDRNSTFSCYKIFIFKGKDIQNLVKNVRISELIYLDDCDSNCES